MRLPILSVFIFLVGLSSAVPLPRPEEVRFQPEHVCDLIQLFLQKSLFYRQFEKRTTPASDGAHPPDAPYPGHPPPYQHPPPYNPGIPPPYRSYYGPPHGPWYRKI